jgi:hypothetical protein
MQGPAGADGLHEDQRTLGAAPSTELVGLSTHVPLIVHAMYVDASAEVASDIWLPSITSKHIHSLVRVNCKGAQ